MSPKSLWSLRESSLGPCGPSPLQRRKPKRIAGNNLVATCVPQDDPCCFPPCTPRTISRLRLDSSLPSSLVCVRVCLLWCRIYVSFFLLGPLDPQCASSRRLQLFPTRGPLSKPTYPPGGSQHTLPPGRHGVVADGVVQAPPECVRRPCPPSEASGCSWSTFFGGPDCATITMASMSGTPARRALWAPY